MGERKKLDYDAFLARGAYDSFDIQYCLDRLMEADHAFQESDALLQATEDITGIDYASQSDRFYRILDAYGKLRRFMNRYVEEVWDVDKEFYSAVANGPAEALSHVRLEDIRIPNTLGLSNHDARAGTDIPLPHLSIKEFIREPETLNNNYVKGFAELFQEEVELAGEPMTLKEFLEELEKASAYSNDIHKPWLEILSGLLNMASFGVKPLYECICGYDIITGEQLSTGERVWTGVEAVLDFLPVFGVAKAAEKGLVKTLGAETVNGLENRLRGGVVRNAVESGSSTGTVWDNIIATQDNYPNTSIPKSFEVEVNGQKMWIHGNATEHMYEDVYAKIAAGEGTAYTNPNLYTQELMSDFYGSLEQATASGIQYGELISAGNWEFIFAAPRQEGLLPVIKHAQFNGW